MSESAEGIGGRKWSLSEAAGDGGVERFVVEGKHPIARLDYVGSDAELGTPRLQRGSVLKVRQEAKGIDGRPADFDAAIKRLANMVAKAVGKTDWTDVLQ